jgi:hypothetical protein
MVKININIEGEDIEEIMLELFNIGKSIIRSNREEFKNLIENIAEDTIDVLMERKILEKGANLYKKINTEINYQYKRS